MDQHEHEPAPVDPTTLCMVLFPEPCTNLWTTDTVGFRTCDGHKPGAARAA